MKKCVISIILNLLIINIYCQDIDFSSFKVDKNGIKGKLMLINETHNVATNNLSYYLIIKELTKKFDNSDTLNIFVERPFTMGFMYNKILQNEDTLRKLKWTDFPQNKLPINAWLDSLASLKKNIRFVGVDFEYDEGKRVKSYKYFFETLREEFAKVYLPAQTLDDYIEKINTNSIEKKDIESLGLFLKSIPLRKKSTTDALFVLEAKHQFFGYRDENNFERFNQIIRRNIDVKNQYNLLIYGSNHVNPTRSKNLFNLFNQDKSSPFLNNTLLIANYYFDCTAYGFYGSKEPSKANEGLYETKGDKLVMDELKKKDWKSKIFAIKNEFSLPLQSFDRILYFVVHKE